jgi:hypothetical protein
MMECHYCTDEAVKEMICNDWGNIPLCNKTKCRKKFDKENTSQFYERAIVKTELGIFNNGFRKGYLKAIEDLEHMAEKREIR